MIYIYIYKYIYIYIYLSGYITWCLPQSYHNYIFLYRNSIFTMLKSIIQTINN